MEINRIGDISAFVASVKYGSFTHAAKHLGLSRSAIGKSIGWCFKKYAGVKQIRY